MRRIGWLDTAFGGVGQRVAHALNEAAAGLENLEITSRHLAEQVGKLFRLDVAQAREIERLNLVVRVLTEVLVDSMGLDEKVLQYRVEAALEEAESTRQEAEAKGKQVTCTTCGASVPLTRTEFTGYGLVCEI